MISDTRPNVESDDDFTPASNAQRLENPIFVVGALRSGTTLFRLMLDSHKDIANPGEADFIFDYLKMDNESGKWSFDSAKIRIDRTFQLYRLRVPQTNDGEEAVYSFIDQFHRNSSGRLSLNIHRNIDKVASILPDAKILHVIRDPRDVARSCISMGWAGNAYYGVDQWLKVESEFDQFITRFHKDNVMTCHYERLIMDTQRQLEEVCEFIGVSFSPDMLAYHEHSTYQAPDSGAVQQWKAKLDARDVALVEIKTKPLLLARGYELSNYPLDPPGLLEQIRLIYTNKLFKWRFACSRYGHFNFFMEKVTRKLMKSRHALFAQRINEIDNQYLK